MSLATLVVEGALGKGGADPGTTDTFHWCVWMKTLFAVRSRGGGKGLGVDTCMPAPPFLWMNHARCYVTPIVAVHANGGLQEG